MLADYAALKPVLLCSNPCVLSPQANAPIALLPRLKAGVIAVGAAALLATGPAAFAADLVVGEEVFNNNCGEKGRRRLEGVMLSLVVRVLLPSCLPGNSGTWGGLVRAATASQWDTDSRGG